MRIKNKINKIVNQIKIYFLEFRYMLNKPKTISSNINSNRTIKFLNNDFKEIQFLTLGLDYEQNNILKWVGAVNYKNYIYCIPNNFNKILKFDALNYNLQFIDFKVPNRNFQWTGGCLYKNKIYGFPRSSNELLSIDVSQQDKVNLIQLNINYSEEHHYGGVLTPEGIVYQPPRRNNTVLVIDLNNNSSREIKICSKKIKLSYISGKFHSNGLIYFLPEKKERVLVFNPKTEEFWFIGKKLDAMVFDVAIAPNGYMYGFSGYCKGMLKIDPYKNKTKIICKNIGYPGAYGSKLTFNGKIYSIPGNGDNIFEFDSTTEKAKVIYTFNKKARVKYAGGCLQANGDIFCTPAMSNKLMIIKFNHLNKGEFDINKHPFIDNF